MMCTLDDIIYTVRHIDEFNCHTNSRINRIATEAVFKDILIKIHTISSKNHKPIREVVGFLFGAISELPEMHIDPTMHEHMITNDVFSHALSLQERKDRTEFNEAIKMLNQTRNIIAHNTHLDEVKWDLEALRSALTNVVDRYSSLHEWVSKVYDGLTTIDYSKVTSYKFVTEIPSGVDIKEAYPPYNNLQPDQITKLKALEYILTQLKQDKRFLKSNSTNVRRLFKI